MDFSQHVIDGCKYLAEAEAELNKSNWWWNRIDKYKAIILLNNSATSYLLALGIERAITIYIRILQIITSFPKLKLNFDIMKIIINYLKTCNKHKILANIQLLEKINVDEIKEMLHKYKYIVDYYNDIAYNYE